MPQWVDELPVEYVDEQMAVWRAEADEEMAAERLKRLKERP